MKVFMQKEQFFMRRALSALAIGVALVAAGPAAAGSLKAASAPAPAIKATPPGEVARHKAIYDFDLVSVRSGAGVTDITGKMYYEQDDNCEAWTTDHRFQVEYQYPERPSVENSSHYVAFESKDAHQFYYSSEREENGRKVEQVRGSVNPNEDGTAKAAYSRPENLSYDVPKGYMLPTQHTNEIIRHARADEHFFNAVMFDGTDADGPVTVNTFIGKQLTPAELKEIYAGKNEIDPTLLNGQAWRVRLAVFPVKEEKSMTSAYEMDLVLHDNGIVSWSLVDYHAFKIEQKILALQKLPAKKCK